jgi:MFS family permease
MSALDQEPTGGEPLSTCSATPTLDTTLHPSLYSPNRAVPHRRGHELARAAYQKWRNAKTWMRTPASKQSRLSLDWLNFFMADVQTGFGTFVALYLADLGWAKGSVGLALAAGQIAAVVGQIPGGALTDAVTWKRALTAIGIVMVFGAALILAVAPLYPLVFAAEVLHGLSAALVVPAIAAISLGLVGRRAMSARTGRNYSYNSAGNALTAIVMGLIGGYFSIRAIFIAAAGLCLPALFALSQVRGNEIDYRRARNAEVGGDHAKFHSVLDIAKNRKLVFFTLCLVLFQFADASLLPLVVQNLGSKGAGPTSLLTSGLIAAPQFVVVLIAPWVGYYSESIGRKPILLFGFATEAARALLFAFVGDYSMLFFAQVLGGITSGIVGVLTVLVITDLTTGTGRFNVTTGVVTTLSTIAASVSVALSGFLFDTVGQMPTFVAYAGIALAAAGVAWMFLQETRPEEYLD